MRRLRSSTASRCTVSGIRSVSRYGTFTGKHSSTCPCDHDERTHNQYAPDPSVARSVVGFSRGRDTSGIEGRASPAGRGRGHAVSDSVTGASVREKRTSSGCPCGAISAVGTSRCVKTPTEAPIRRTPLADDQLWESMVPVRRASPECSVARGTPVSGCAGVETDAASARRNTNAKCLHATVTPIISVNGSESLWVLRVIVSAGQLRNHATLSRVRNDDQLRPHK